MISKAGSDIYSIDESDIKTPNKLLMEAKRTQFWGRRLELGKSIFKTSSILVNEIGTKVDAANENGDTEVLVSAFKQYTEKVCKENFLDGNGENPVLPEWVKVAKSKMMETL